VIRRQIVSNPEQPCNEPRGRSVSLSSAVDANENVLREVLGVMLISQARCEVDHEATLVGNEELRESGIVSLLDLQHQSHAGIVE
jgi:hypothetical protein